METDAHVELFRAVIYRALYDALGFTGLNKSSEDHKEVTSEARMWFFQDIEDLEMCCNLAELDFRKVHGSSIKLIQAKQSGNFEKIPDFWRECFRRNRAPSYGALQKTIDLYMDKM